jgi:outer membrane protein OmpA-like peptidoglycan-associated protein
MTARTVLLSLLVAAVPGLMTGEAEAQSVPLVKGLTIVTAGQWTRGDYESLKQVTEVTDSGIRISYSGRIPGVKDPKEEFTVMRQVRDIDLRQARRYKISFSPLDEEIALGTTAIGTSSKVLGELKGRGSAQFWIINQTVDAGTAGAGASLTDLANAFKSGSDYKGTLSVVEAHTTVPVVLAGERVMLAAVHARGRFGEGEPAQVGDFWFLDDSSNPLALKFAFGSGTLQVVRIDFPAPNRIEKALAAKDTAVAYGLYFEFASAEIRPESEPVLHEIAGVMQRHPDWKLRVAGHTDSIGGAASNLELSRKRAEAVRKALGKLGVPLSRLEATGYGAAVPKESNTTLEGRARNRRVELTRT